MGWHDHFLSKSPLSILAADFRLFLHTDTDSAHAELRLPETPNTLCYKGKGVCAPLLKHLRHSIAHACIECEGDYYVINPQMNPKCQICGKVKRTDFKNLITAILATKE